MKEPYGTNKGKGGDHGMRHIGDSKKESEDSKFDLEDEAEITPEADSVPKKEAAPPVPEEPVAAVAAPTKTPPADSEMLELDGALSICHMPGTSHHRMLFRKRGDGQLIPVRTLRSYPVPDQLLED